MKRGYFITGTDTGVGKTFIACGLARAFMELRLSVGVMKPVETGCCCVPKLSLGTRDASSATFPRHLYYPKPPRQRKVALDALVPTDALMLMDAAKSTDPLDIVNPYRFKTPVAPNIAGRLERRKISVAKIKKSFKAIADKHDVTLVEGAGGILSPVTDNLNNAGLARMLGLDVIIVVPSRLGAVNQALLAIEAARMRGLTVSAVVLNLITRKGQGVSLRYNMAEIKRLGGVRIVETG
ncbi:MAG: dethiobiotin synthase [Deltaproteobacteria bacterium]|nr:dethiobiotin synthase [Deltaproteobacteria bacterium]